MFSLTSTESTNQLFQPIQLTFRRVLAVLEAIILQAEAVLFIFGLHPGYLIHRLSSTMQRLTSVFGLGSVNLSGPSNPNQGGHADGQVVKRNRVGPGLRRRKAAVVDEENRGKPIDLTRSWQGVLTK